MLDLNLARLNREMVDARPLTAEELLRVKELLTKHRAETESQVAHRLLEGSDEELQRRFTTLMPRDYARVMQAKANAELAGLDEETTTKLMMEASHG